MSVRPPEGGREARLEGEEDAGLHHGGGYKARLSLWLPARLADTVQWPPAAIATLHAAITAT